MTNSEDRVSPSTFSQLLCNENRRAPLQFKLDSYELAYFSKPWHGGSAAVHSEQINQDSAAMLIADDGSGVVVVADGMGGHRSGASASALTVNAIVESVLSALRHDRLLRSGIIDGFEEANARVQALGSGAGTTLAVAELGRGYVRPYHCGDSIVMLTSNRGRVKLLTASHSPVGMAVEAGFLDQDEALHHPERHLVSNAIGTAEMRIEIGSAVPFQGRDSLLLASDGLTDNLSLAEIVETIRKGPILRAVQRLVSLCQQRMLGDLQDQPSKPDDLTVLVARPSSREKRETGRVKNQSEQQISASS